jgi:hypothetical protein
LCRLTVIGTLRFAPTAPAATRFQTSRADEKPPGAEPDGLSST